LAQTDTLDRTELIMLITPHVVRNRDEAKQVTEDFKKSLSAVRNELERMEETTKPTAKALENRQRYLGPLRRSRSDPNPPHPLRLQVLYC